MAFAVELHLGPETETAVYDTWQALAALGIDRSMLDSGARPHVTLAISDHVDQRGLEDATAAFAATLQPVRLTLSSVGLFPTAENVLFYGVSVTHALLELHDAYSRVFAAHARQPYAYYRPGTWVPHCTLAMGLMPDQLTGALAVVRRNSLPLYGMAHELGFIEIADGLARTLTVFQIGRPA